MEPSEDRILQDGGNGAPPYIWQPLDLHSLQIKTPWENTYKDLRQVSTTVHFDDYRRLRKVKQFDHKKVSDVDHTAAGEPCRNQEGFWFTVHDPTKDEDHNPAGNVSLLLDLDYFLHTLNQKEIKVYLLECVDLEKRSISRLLVTTQHLNLPVYDPTREGGPWHKDEEGRHHFLTKARRFNAKRTKANQFPHSVQFFLHVAGEEASSRLWRAATVKPANHSEANYIGQHCTKLQSDWSRTREKCQFQWSKEEARVKLAGLPKEEAAED